MHFETGNVLSGRFSVEIKKCLEIKPHSEIYIGEIQNTNIKVVVKVGNIFLQKEYELLSALRYPVIARVLDFVKEENVVYIIMPYYEGVTLETMVLQYGPLAQIQVLHITKQLCEILMFLQERPRAVLHNDIKPANILLQDNGRVVLLDFGLACFEGEVRKGVLFQGSLGYAAPECWHQDGCSLTKATDVFALGATMYRLLTGKKPGEHYGRFVLPDGEIRKNWQEIINKCCTLEMRYRFQNAAQLLDALHHM